MTTYGPFFTALPALPRGPHHLSRDEVAASQRMRLMAGVATAVAEQGYASTTIASITERAGVSPRTFYEHYEDKLNCYLAAYERFAAVLASRIAAGLDSQTGWQEFAVRALDAYLGSLEDNPDVARAFLIEIDGAGPEARRRRRDAYAQFAAMIRESHERVRQDDPRLAELPLCAYSGLVHGVRAVVCERLEDPGPPALRELAPDLLRWMAATFYGAAEAAALQPEALRRPA